MKHFFFILCFLFTTSIQNTYAQDPSTPESSNTYGIIHSLVSSIQNLSLLTETLQQEKVSLKFEENLSLSVTPDIENLTQIIQEKKSLLEKNKDAIEAILSSTTSKLTPEQESAIRDLDEQNSRLQSEIDPLILEKKNLLQFQEERHEKQKENIETARLSILTLEEDIIKQKSLIRNQSRRLFLNILWITTLVLFLFGARYMGKKLIQRFSPSSPERKQALYSLNNGVFNVVIGSVVIGIMFSQIINLLPFIAILGTGIAFAVRDSIACFIGWFVIGSERGYRIGHIIQVNEAFGEVYDIGPILTRLQEIKNGEKTGKFISIPNRLIFDIKIINLSRNHNYIQESIVFLLDHQSDIQLAQKVFNTILQKETATALQKQKEIYDGSSSSRIQLTEKGVEIHGKFWVKFDDINAIKENITHAFIQAIKENPSIKIQYILH